MPLDRGSSNTLKPRIDLTDREMSSAVQSTQHRQYFGIEMSPNVKFMAAEPGLYRICQR